MTEVTHPIFHQLLILLLSITLCSTANTCDYSRFLTECNRSAQINLTSQKYLAKSKYFEERCLQNIKHNQQEGVTYKNAQYYCNSTDATEQELAKKLGLNRVKTDQITRSAYNPTTEPGKVAATTLPSSYNYVALGYVTSVKNQGSCGCCWSFASIAMYESLLLKRGYSYALSQQASLQCTSYYAPNKRVSDCSGGYFSDPLTYLGKVGSVLRNDYPYISGSYGSGKGFPVTPNICAQANRISIGNGTAAIYGPLTQTQLKTLLINQGPLMVGVYANYEFTQYSSGVFTGCPADAASYINHAVLLVGYDDATSSWLIKNQWDNNWGEEGYIRISYSKDCGLSTLIGNIQFSSYNTNPSIAVDKSLLFSSSQWESKTLITLFLSLLLMALL